MPWGKIPAEIRIITLDNVAEDYRFKTDHLARAGYASFCREWRPVFEQQNFRRLVVDQDRVLGL